MHTGWVASLLSTALLDHHVDTLTAHFGPFSHIPRKPLDSSILRANKAIYAEAREILYGHNTFFLGMLHTGQAAAVRLTKKQVR